MHMFRIGNYMCVNFRHMKYVGVYSIYSIMYSIMYRMYVCMYVLMYECT